MFNAAQNTPDGVLTQSFATTIGQTYVLSFDLGATAYQSTDEQRMQVTVQGDNVLLSQTASVFAQGTGTWYEHKSFTFVADSLTTTLTFQDISPTSFDIDLLLDNVRVTPLLRLISAVSRMMHGNLGPFDVNLPLTGSPGVECRTPHDAQDANHTLVYTVVFAFNNNIVSGNAIVSGTGSVFEISTPGDKTMTVKLSGVGNMQQLTVTLSNVTDEFSQVLPDTPVSVDILIGDTSGNRLVNSTDVSQTQSESGHAVTSFNFRKDVNANGLINSTDVSIVQSKSGTGLP